MHCFDTEFGVRRVSILVITEYNEEYTLYLYAVRRLLLIFGITFLRKFQLMCYINASWVLIASQHCGFKMAGTWTVQYTTHSKQRCVIRRSEKNITSH